MNKLKVFNPRTGRTTFTTISNKKRSRLVGAKVKYELIKQGLYLLGTRQRFRGTKIPKLNPIASVLSRIGY